LGEELGVLGVGAFLAAGDDQDGHVAQQSVGRVVEDQPLDDQHPAAFGHGLAAGTEDSRSRRRRGARRAGDLIEPLDIGEWAHTIGQRLSGGVKRLVGYAMVTVWPGASLRITSAHWQVPP